MRYTMHREPQDSVKKTDCVCVNCGMTFRASLPDVQHLWELSGDEERVGPEYFSCTPAGIAALRTAENLDVVEEVMES